MSGIAYWSPALEPDMPDRREELEWPDIFGLGAGHVW
jgi:hypothetical protein